MAVAPAIATLRKQEKLGKEVNTQTWTEATGGMLHALSFSTSQGHDSHSLVIQHHTHYLMRKGILKDQQGRPSEGLSTFRKILSTNVQGLQHSPFGNIY